jgi:hypothetical protein
MDLASPDHLAAVVEGIKPLLDWRDVPLDIASLAALAAGLGWASGLRLYALVFVLGGTLAAGTHLAKASARAAINTSPEPFSNVLASFAEDALFAGGMWTLLHQPLLFLGVLVVFIALAVALIVVLWRFVRSLLRPRATAG